MGPRQREPMSSQPACPGLGTQPAQVVGLEHRGLMATRGAGRRAASCCWCCSSRSASASAYRREPASRWSECLRSSACRSWACRPSWACRSCGVPPVVGVPLVDVPPEPVGVVAQAEVVIVFVSRLTAPVSASKRPSSVAPVPAVIVVCAITVPTKVEPNPSVAEAPTSQ